MYFASAPAGISGFRIKCGMTKAGIPESRIGVRDDWETASGAIEQTKKPIIKRCGMTKAGIPGSRIKVRDDQMTVSGAMTKTRSPVRPMGESGKKNGGEGRTWEKDV